MHCVRDEVPDAERAEYQEHIARLRKAAGHSTGCGYCSRKSGRVIRFIAYGADDGVQACCFDFVTCTTCGHCERVKVHALG